MKAVRLWFTFWQTLRQSITPTSIHPSRSLLLLLLLLLRLALSDYGDAVIVRVRSDGGAAQCAYKAPLRVSGPLHLPPALGVSRQRRRRNNTALPYEFSEIHAVSGY